MEGLDQVIRLIESRVMNDVLKGVKELKPLKNPFALEKLISLFGSDFWPVRKAAAQAVIEYGAESLEPLKQTYQQDDLNIKYWVIYVLGHLGKKGIGLLIHIIDNGTPFLKMCAITAIARNSEPEVIEKLISLLASDDWGIRKKVSDSIAEIGKECIPFLKKAFLKENSNIRYWAIRLLGRMAGNERVAIFKDLLLSDKKDHRYHAVVALGEMKSAKAVELLIGALKDESWIVRRQAAELLVKMGKGIIRFLKVSFDEGSADQKYWIIRIMSQILGSEAIAFLKNLLYSKEEELRYFAITAMSEIKEETIVELLVEKLSDPSWIVRKHAADALTTFGEDAIDEIAHGLESENEDVRYWSINILAKLGGKAVDILFKKINQCEFKHRHYMVSSLGQIRKKNITVRMIEFLKDESWPIRNTVFQYLLQRGPKVISWVADSLDTSCKDMCHWAGQIFESYPETFEAMVVGKFMEDDFKKCEQYIRILNTIKSRELSERVMKSFIPDDEKVLFWFRQLLIGQTLSGLEEIMKMDIQNDLVEVIQEIIEKKRGSEEGKKLEDVVRINEKEDIYKNMEKFIISTTIDELMTYDQNELIKIISHATNLNYGFILEAIEDYSREVVVGGVKRGVIELSDSETSRPKDKLTWFQKHVKAFAKESGFQKPSRTRGRIRLK